MTKCWQVLNLLEHKYFFLTSTKFYASIKEAVRHDYTDLYIYMCVCVIYIYKNISGRNLM